jgi:hypothetical protein
MKKQTKTIITTLVIVIIMGFSTIAFVVLERIPETGVQTIEKPTKFVYDGKLNESYREAYMKMGYSLLEFHRYQGCCQMLEFQIEALPEYLDGLIIEKVDNESTRQTGPYVRAESILSETQTNSTNFTDIFNAICTTLPKPPIDCGLMQTNTTFDKNTTKNLTE